MNLRRFRRRRVTGCHPDEPRSHRGFERQRLEALALIRERRAEIVALAHHHGICADAIAGAILWDALENPYRRRWLRLRPGKVHPIELGRPSDAERAENAGLVPFAPGGPVSRVRILRRPDGALGYVAGILAFHADTYATIAGVDIRHDAGVLCTFYQGGNSGTRAARLAERRAADPRAMPRAADEMGPWVVTQRPLIRALLTPPARAYRRS
jgi:hypothetical protein